MFDDLQFIVTFVLTAVWNILPLFLLTVFVATMIHALKFDTAIRAAFQKQEGLSVLLATAVGAFSPFCSCTVVPVVAGLLQSGVPLAPVMAFWIASPTMDPEIFAMTVGVLGLPLALVRLGAVLALSLGGGYLTMFLARKGWLGGILRQKSETAAVPVAAAVSAPTAVPAAVPAGAQLVNLDNLVVAPQLSVSASGAAAVSTCEVPAAPRTTRWWQSLADSLNALDWQDVGRTFAKQAGRLGGWMVLAFVLEALITLYVPQEAIASVLGSGFLPVPLAAVIGIPLYLSNASALPIVSGLLAQGMQPGAAIAFLIAGPVTTIPAMAAVWGVVNRRVFALYLGIGLVGAILMGALANLLLA